MLGDGTSPAEASACSLILSIARLSGRAGHWSDMTASTGTPVLTDDDFKVADLSLAGFGRKEIQLAEHEMPGLWPCAPSTATPSRWPEPASPARCT
jgi:hypothetical protein